MWTTIECAGHPRDMGFAQGLAARSAVRAELVRARLPVDRSRWPSLRALVSGPVRGGGAGREFYRHFAHQSERLEGLAQGAGAPVDSLLDLHLRVRAGGVHAGLLARRASLRARTVGAGETKRALLERSLPRPIEDEAGWIVRESRPAVGFASLEIGLPWLVSSIAGVNEGGLSVLAGPQLWGRPGREGWPPSALLVQECLQRFDRLDGALDWCRKRPVEGDQSFVLADATGAVATVIANGRDRRVQSGEGELHLEAGDLAGDGVDLDADEPADRVLLDPNARRLQLDAAGMTIDVAL